MSDHGNPSIEPDGAPNRGQEPDDERPEWLEEFEDLANEQLGHGSACAQVHPIIERWFNRLMEGAPPASRPSVQQAVSCLATEVIYSTPADLLDALFDAVDEEALAIFVEHILLVGRAFEISLRNGELDDL